MKRRIFIGCLGIMVMLVFVSLSQEASTIDYPKNPITLVAPYPAGGRTDLIGRIFIQTFSKYLKQPVVLVNKAGAGTVLGTLEVIKANPDGYTLGILSNGLVASHYVLPDTPVLWKDLETIAMFNFDPTCMAAAEKTGFKNLKELIAFAKKNPKELSTGINQGTATSLYTFAFMKLAGIEVTYVPFKGGGEGKTALAGGHIDAHFDAPYIYKPLVDAQKVRFMGISSVSRDRFFPDIPTFKEQGLDITWGSWHGIFAPKGTPPEVIQVLEKAIEKTVADKELLDMFNKNQISIVYKNQPEYIRFLENEDKVYQETATETGIYKPKK
jgi:tripartite-type tricarboxylate transporter receptor subunit TctC